MQKHTKSGKANVPLNISGTFALIHLVCLSRLLSCWRFGPTGGVDKLEYQLRLPTSSSGGRNRRCIRDEVTGES